MKEANEIRVQMILSSQSLPPRGLCGTKGAKHDELKR